MSLRNLCAGSRRQHVADISPGNTGICFGEGVKKLNAHSPHPLVFKFLVRRHGGGNPVRAWAPNGLHIMDIGDANADRTTITPHNLGVAAWN
jgi:hypothetical protein